MVTRPNLCAMLGIRYPIIQAPMAGSTTPALVAAVSNAGGLGIHGAAYLSPDRIRDDIIEIRKLTDRPFGINLFAGGRDAIEGGDPERMLDILGRFHTVFGLDPPSVPASAPDPLPAQLEVVIDARVPVFTFTFGIPDPAVIAELKRRKSVVVGTATTVAEARQLESAGVDAVVAQGSEAGAHRGTFAAPFDQAMIGTMALVPQVVDAVRIPVIASGGIMDGRGIVAAEALGAEAVQLGTAFLACHETSIPVAYKQAIRTTQAEQTVLTRAFSGRPARGILNEYLRAWQDNEAAALPFPIQNDATRPLRNAAAARNDAEFLSLWAGQGGALARDVPAARLVALLVREVAEVRGSIASDRA